MNNSCATSSDWDIKPMPEDVSVIDCSIQYLDAEMKQIEKGIIPEEMEEKWFIYFEDDKLYFHRSWSEKSIYSQ